MTTLRTLLAILALSERAASLRTTFEFLGALAMQELTASPEVKNSVSMFERFVDRSRISAVLDDR